MLADIFHNEGTNAFRCAYDLSMDKALGGDGPLTPPLFTAGHGLDTMKLRAPLFAAGLRNRLLGLGWQVPKAPSSKPLRLWRRCSIRLGASHCGWRMTNNETNNVDTRSCCRPFVVKLLCRDGIRDIFWRRQRRLPGRNNQRSG